MAILIEDYRRAEGVIEPAEESERSGYKALCTELGLSALAVAVPPTMRTLGLVLYPALSLYELRVWSAFLPSRYSKYRYGLADRARIYRGYVERYQGSWSTYAFDTIPLDVLHTTRDVAERRLFEDLQIWTPEATSRDPMLVGVLGPETAVDVIHGSGHASYCPLMRWGESLAPFEEIERSVWDTWFDRTWIEDEGQPPSEIVGVLCAYLNEGRSRHVGGVGYYRGVENYFCSRCGQPTHEIGTVGLSNVILQVCGSCGYVHERGCYVGQ